ncbi:hypothetical protein [Azospirillum sp. TSO22-1]|uniref:hypothetical protein n=1 Tax=Azospirillum sp. TSO22-1 TaxID=716789 RepID=UPI000D61B876|nr:hypothetical protein [Azospirillum sp. TSO22-1]PWC53607.1 hypothetical protein TSO221_10275 [Azospirillum sp. TSO22-1]
MRSPFATFPDEPTLTEIAREWPLGGKATDADVILERLVQFMWRGDFEADGRPTLFTLERPEGCTIGVGGAVYRNSRPRDPQPFIRVIPTWAGPGGISIIAESGRGLPFLKWSVESRSGHRIGSDDPFVHDPAFEEAFIRFALSDDLEDPEEPQRSELVMERVRYPRTRAEVLDILEVLGFRIEGATGSPEAKFAELAGWSLREYDDSHGHFSNLFRLLRIRLSDLAEWFDSVGLDWPRPRWLLRASDDKQSSGVTQHSGGMAVAVEWFKNNCGAYPANGSPRGAKKAWFSRCSKETGIPIKTAEVYFGRWSSECADVGNKGNK